MVGKGILQEAKGRLLRRMKMRDMGGNCEQSWLGKAHDKDMYVWVTRVDLSWNHYLLLENLFDPTVLPR